MSPAEMAGFGAATIFAIMALIAFARITKLRARIEELEAEIQKQKKAAAPKPPAGQAPKKKPLPPPKRKKVPPPTGEDGKKVFAHAVQMIQSARGIANHLGFEAAPDPKQPTVFKLTVPLASDLDRKAAEWLNDRPFDCIEKWHNKKDNAEVLLDMSKSGPK